VVGALSLATDLGTGQPLEHALRTAVLAVRLGELAGASAQELADTYYVALLHASGCTSNGHEAAQLFGVEPRRRGSQRRILATTTVEDYDRFVSIYSTKGAEKRAQHGSKGSRVYRDPNEADRVWAIFDWDAEGWQRFASDPEVPGIMQEAGHKGRPQVLELDGTYDA